MINSQNEKQIAPALRMYNEPEYHMTPDDEVEEDDDEELVDYNYAEIMLDNYGLKNYNDNDLQLNTFPDYNKGRNSNLKKNKYRSYIRNK